ncbi:unnamed protein product, partial [Prorocentrum cordatum]
RRPVHACRRADEQAAGGCVSRRGSHRADAERPGRGAASRHAERPDAADADERRAAEWWRHAEQRHVRQRHAAPQHHAHRPAAAWRGARARHGWRPGRPGPLPGGRRPAGPLVAAHARALAGGPREEREPEAPPQAAQDWESLRRPASPGMRRPVRPSPLGQPTDEPADERPERPTGGPRPSPFASAKPVDIKSRDVEETITRRRRSSPRSCRKWATRPRSRGGPRTGLAPQGARCAR